MNEDCPICEPGTCKGYPHLWRKLREDHDRWFAFHEKINGRTVPQISHAMEYPSLFQQAKNAAAAAGSVVASIVRGEVISVPQEEQDRRLAICHECEFWDSTQGRCSKCGCFGQWKTWLATQKCPISKW